jgi:phospholipase/carboxylesterase
MPSLPAVEIVSPTGSEPNAAVIWLHGLGADGNDFAPIVPQLALADGLCPRFVFPHAPSIPVTINNGFVMPAWYDIKQMDVERHLDEDQLRQSAAWTHEFIQQELDRGIPAERIVVAGFSQGGAVAFEAGLSFHQRLAGIMALSTYFPTADSVKLDQAQARLPIMICHGSADPVVPEALGQKSLAAPQGMGFTPEYHSYPMEHAVCPPEIADIAGWLSRVLSGAGQGA